MKLLYLLTGITRQGHLQSVKRLEEELAKEPFLIGLIVEIREMHPGMGLRTIYEQFSPEGIGRDSFIALGLRNGFRLRAVQNPQITTRIIKNRRYPNLLEGKRFTGVNQLWTSDIFIFLYKVAIIMAY